ncbi:hypothetical protein H2200_001256 [Cladophialophora chaetospira]|uniref:Knr4/Smi1-like domain-containing protein n=1 Tax=Cladophialophora chaetospira TaxID=386627 RepID=A0AA38XKJ2_9EURO|nr:hypothetical protein H2200_001256 [Cladophialophora chaetospira]
MTEASAPSTRERYPAFEFLLRHIDDAPTISHSRFQQDVVERVEETALGFALVGEIEGATKLLSTLRAYGVEPFHVSIEYSQFLKPCMYFAWDATLSWPDWIAEDDRTEASLLKLEEQGRRSWLERFSDEWVVDEETAKKGLVLADGGLCDALPNVPIGERVRIAEQWWKDGKFPYAASPNGPMHVRYASMSSWWRMGTFPYPYMQLFKSAGLMIALDIYLRLNRDEEAQNVLGRVCERFTLTDQAEMLAGSRTVWKKLLSGPEKPVLELLEIHPAKMRNAVSRSVSLLESRLANGPSRPFRNKGLKDLVHLVSAHTFENCPYDVLERYGAPRRRPKDYDGLLRDPCTGSEISQLESRLEISLPQDYKDFLAVTNGMDPVWNGSHLLKIFARADEIDYMNTDHLQGSAINLVREYDPPSRGGNMLDWPVIADELSFQGVPVSGTGTGGDLWLVKPELTTKCKDYFFKTYQERTKEQQKELDRVIHETYESMQAFEAMEWGLISWTTWGIEMVPYNGMRDMLERLAEQSMRIYRLWSHVFEPDFRIYCDE